MALGTLEEKTGPLPEAEAFFAVGWTLTKAKENGNKDNKSRRLFFIYA